MSPPKPIRRVLLALVALALSTAGVALPSAAIAAPPPDSASLQVERLYYAYFDRAPESEGLTYWTTRRLSGLSLVAISTEFSLSDEFVQTYGALDNWAFVDLVYENVLGRSPYAGGFEYWTGELDSGRLGRGEVMVGFSESLEFVLRLGHLDGDQVRRLYRAFFLREADPDGLVYWWGRQIGGMSLSEIADQFAAEAEFANRYGSLSDREFVGLVYENVLERSPDSTGLEYWIAVLASGSLTRGRMMVEFSESEEFSGNPKPAAGTNLGGCDLFPGDSFWYSSARNLPVLSESAQYVESMGANDNAHADFGAGLRQGSPIGIPFSVSNPADSTAVSFDYADESDAGPYPITASSPIEGGGDRHILTVESGICVLHELYYVRWQANGTIEAGSGARWDLSSNLMRNDGWTSADAAGLPILPGLVRYDEVAAGSIDHVIRFTADATANSYVWPASHRAGSNGSNLPPMGSWIRLKASVDPDDFTGQARVIVMALKEHGAVLADNGSSWYFSGAPDDRWNNDELQQLHNLTGSMFEFVDASSLRVAPNSYAASGS